MPALDSRGREINSRTYPADILSKYRQIVKDPWVFLKECVYTKDEVDECAPVKKFPSHYKYLYLYTRVWQREKLLIVPKSRRMYMSWINIGLYTWDAAFKTDRFEVFQSKKEEDSDSLIARAEFILDNMKDVDLPRELIPKYKKTFCQLEFPEIASKIVGFAQGEDQLRQYTASGMLLDEFAFWDKAEATFGAAKPTLEGGGRCTILSSAAPGYMKRLVNDTLDDPIDDPFAALEAIS